MFRNHIAVVAIPSNRFVASTVIVLLILIAGISRSAVAQPIQIGTIEDLQKIGNDPAYPLSGGYVLTRDIDASATVAWNSGAGFDPIGTDQNPFTGTMDGQGHVIIGLSINDPGHYNAGLFGMVSGGQIRNVGLLDASVAGTGNVGGLAGVNMSGTITQCYVTGAVSGFQYVGGLAGANNYGGDISQCYAQAAVAGSQYVGGLLGDNFNNGTVRQCYATGAVSAPANAGGLLGQNESEETATDCYWDTETTGQATSVGGTGEPTAAMMAQATFAGWDFTSAWSIVEGQTYPFLRALPGGSLTVRILPAAAVAAGAQWSMDGGTTWYAGGATTGNILAAPVKPVTVTFKPVSGWTAPAAQTVTIMAGQTTTVTGTYAQTVTVPDVTGMAQVAAQAAIADALLRLGTLTQRYDSDVPLGHVISQDPEAGAIVFAGTAVNIVVSLGAVPIVSVPNVVGMAQADATAAITGALLALGTVTRQYSATVPVDDVMSQNPAAGFRVTAGAAVNLVMSDGPAPPVFVSENGDNSTGNSWETALHAVSDGMVLARSAGRDVWIAEGVYPLAAGISVPSNMNVYGGFPGTGDPTMAQRDPAAHVTKLDGQHTIGPLVVCSGVTNVRIDGLTLANAVGHGNGYGAPGALSCANSSSNVTISNCTFADNTAPGFQFGGAINIYESKATIDKCTFYYNSSGAGPGGVDMYDSTATVTECLFEGNFGTGCGGGIGTYGSTLTVDRCSFIDNIAECGGGLESGQGSQTTVTNSLFAGNHASTYAGALEFGDVGTVKVANCTVVDNTAAEIPGGVHIVQSHTASVLNCVFASNNMYVLNEYNNSTVVPIQNCLFLGNTDGVYWDNTIGGVWDVNGSTGLNARVPGAAGNIEGDPLFADASGDNYHILAGSPCLNAGTAAGAPADDFDGEARPSPGRGVDIGFDQLVDTDGDGMPDWWEIANGLDPTVNDAALDPDGDGLTNYQEYLHSCNPHVADTDGDGYPDGEAVALGINPHKRLRPPVFVSQTGDNTDGLSWATAYTSLGPALALAAASPGTGATKDVWVAAEDFDFTATASLGSHTAVYGGFAITSNPQFRDRDAAARGTVLRGNNASISGFTCNGVWDVRIDGFTLTDFAGGSVVPNEYAPGGAINCTNNCYDVTIEHSVLRDNHVTYFGGGFNVTFGANVAIKDCILSGNSATEGGGIKLHQGRLDVVRCLFSGNTGRSFGGGIGSYDSYLAVSESIFENNTAPIGGGVEEHESSFAEVDNCVFAGNETSDRGGGGTFEYDNHVKVANCTVVGNAAGAPGGGISFAHGTVATVLNTIFAANSNYAGAVDSSSSLVGNNCLFSANTNGVLLYNGTEAILSAEGPNGLNAQVGKAFDNIDGDPLFVDASANDFRLSSGSPCVDAGAIIDAPVIDIRGVARPQGAGVDIGAYEGTEGAIAAGTPAAITQQPASVTANPGGTASFTIGAAGSAPLLYQWKKDGTVLPGAINATLTFAPVQLTDQASYTCVVANLALPNGVESVAATLTIPGPPQIATQPLSLTVAPGDPASFLVTACGSTPLSYQWSKDAMPISGVTSPSLAIASCDVSDGGVYFCTVSNSISSTASNTATLTVQTTGALAGVIQPRGAVAMGAQWSIDGGATWNASGVMLRSIPMGSVTVTFKVVPGWTTPASQTVAIVPLKTANVTGTYVAQPKTAPNVTGLAQADATAAITSALLTVGAITQQLSETVPAGIVISQSPAGGASVPTGTPVNLVVSKGPVGPGSVCFVNKNNNSGAEDGQTWATAFRTVQAAVSAARIYGKVEVWIAAGVYDEPRAGSGALLLQTASHIYGGFAGTEDRREERDWLANTTTISGAFARGGQPAYHVIDCQWTSNIWIDGISITGGHANGGGDASSGGGIHANSSGGVENCVIYDNVADNNGGGIACNSSMLNIRNCSFIYNQASSYGGGCYFGSSTETVDTCLIKENTALEGGGIKCEYGGINVSNCHVADNDAINFGGGIATYNTIATSITNSVISGNSATKGGGIECHMGPSLSVVNCVIYNNISSNVGGGIYTDQQVTNTVMNCTISGNTATNYGGGLYAGSSSISIVNTILFNNNSFAIYDAVSSYQATVQFCDLYDNAGGLLYDTKTGTAYAYVGGPSGLDAGMPGAKNNIQSNPYFVDTASCDFQLLPGSPCIDAGTGVNAPATDLLGVARPQGLAVDMGAYEAPGASTGAGRVTVPDVAGMATAGATAAITNALLAVGAVVTQYSSTVPLDYVISQDPSAGTALVPQTPVNLVISLGPPVIVPNVVLDTQAVAQAALASAGLTLGAVTQGFSDAVPAGSVISQNPSAGTTMAAGTAVNLVVSLGPPPMVSVPNVVGLTQARATAAITGALLALGTITQAYSATAPVDDVISQNPARGSIVVAGTAVNLVVSLGPLMVNVPSVVGLAQADATAAIAGALLALGTVTRQYSPAVPVNDVISQHPAGGASVAEGTAVNLVVSRGLAPPIMSITDLGKIGNDPAYPLNGVYVLGQDIDASSAAFSKSSAGFAPIGNQSTPFTGTLDGMGHVLLGLVIDATSQHDVGLFGYIGGGGLVRNLGVEGGLVSGGSYVGGLAGYNAGAVTNCYAADAVSGGYYVGGLVGYNDGTVTDCFATGAVSGTAFAAGGLVGYNDGGVLNCYATGAATGDAVGGLAGFNIGTLTNCYATGAVSGSEYAGGLVGEDGVTSAVTASYWDMETSGLATSAGGTGKTTAEMMSQATFANWDFETVWAISEGQTYPWLRVLGLRYVLALTVNPAGTGTIEASPAGLFYYPGTAVTLVAAASADFTFDHWSGDTAGMPDVTANTATITMDGNKSLTANFVARPQQEYTLAYAADPGGFLLGPTPQIVNYGVSGTAVTAAPSIGFMFLQWSDGSTQNPRTDANVTANISVTASFVYSSRVFALTLSVPGGNGALVAVESAPYSYNEVVHLIATAAAGYQLKQWTGTDNDTLTTLTNTVTMTGDKAVSVSFAPIPASAALNGTVTFEGRPAKPDARWVAALDVVVVPPLPAVPFETTVATDNTGAFTLSGLTSGAYQFWVKGANTLAVSQTVSIADGENRVDFGTLPEGDSNGDNKIALVDFSVLVTTFGKTTGQTGFDAQADFNGDGAVTLVDFSMLVSHFTQIGAPKPAIPQKAAKALVSCSRVEIGNESGAPAVAIEVAPESIGAAVGQTFDVTIEIDTGNAAIDGAAACLAFDPAVLQVEGVRSSGQMPVPLINKFDNAAGQVTFAAGTFSNPVSGAVSLATITFKAVALSDGTVLALVEDNGCETAVTAGGAALPSVTSAGVVIVSTR